MEPPSLLADLEDFVALHRVHGELHAHAGDPTPNGYRLEVTSTWRSSRGGIQGQRIGRKRRGK